MQGWPDNGDADSSSARQDQRSAALAMGASD
jgi:hypothetical protein